MDGPSGLAFKPVESEHQLWPVSVRIELTCRTQRVGIGWGSGEKHTSQNVTLKSIKTQEKQKVVDTRTSFSGSNQSQNQTFHAIYF